MKRRPDETDSEYLARLAQRDGATLRERVATAEWTNPNCEGGQPAAAHFGDIVVYRFADGLASVAVANEWVSAMFESSDAAASWEGAWSEAEIEFRRLNGGKLGPVNVGVRRPS